MITARSQNGKEYILKSDGTYVIKSDFDKLVDELDDEKDVKDPKALAASIGRKKYGKEKFQDMAEKGKTKKAVVLKSLRTEEGAQNWIKVMGLTDAVVMSDETLKSFDDVDYPTPMDVPMPQHVVVVQDMQPVIESVKAGDIGEIVRCFIGEGFMKVDSYGVCFTEKWHKALDEYVAEAMEGALKSVDENVSVSLSKLGGMSVEAHNLMNALFSTVVKSVEDSEKLANTTAPENAESGHELRPEKPISDSEAQNIQTAGKPSPADVDDHIDPEEPISDSEAHSLSTGANTQKAIDDDEDDVNDVDQEDAQGTKEPEDADDSAAGKAVKKRSGKKPGDTFKSLWEAKEWANRNTDPTLYYDRPTLKERATVGRNKAYIVRRKEEVEVKGAFGNRLVR